MRPSIRTFLLINLLLSVTLITSLAIIGNLFLAHKDIQSQLNTQLIQTAFRIEAFFSDYNNPHNLSVIQQNLQKNLNKVIKEHHKINNNDIIKLHNTTEFQIWNNNGKLILHSALAPKIPLSNGQPGLSILWLNSKAWHVYTLYNPDTQLTVMVAERSNYRQHLENQLTQDSIIIMAITYPFLGFLIWMIVGRGLDSLKKVAEEVKHRESTNLKEVNIEAVPSEIEPLVSELNSLFNRLSEAFERNKRFTADAAHELKTPLAALSAQTQVALRADTPEARKQALLKVLSGVNRSTHVVQQLLTLSRMSPDSNLDHEMTEVNLARQASEMAALLAPEAIAKNIDLELLQPDSTATIRANVTSINILLRNLIDNAIRYSHENGFVQIDIEETSDKVILKVIDDGPGIPEELRERVFERFFRMIGNKTTGSGLGLGIVQQIAKLHNAELLLLTPVSGKGLEIQVVFSAA
ncbi:MAG: two-component sensor histidine kinase [Gammaproteobacteria bacterium]|nr:two-component sensor histidine kinase [Gammaproteobacteria bacterium]MCH9743719.1 two-component sensor histidine kinase [Gammaproteobacteria bacterium]